MNRKAVVIASVAVLLAGALALSACASKNGSSGTDDGKQTADSGAPLEWTPESDCSKCHTVEASSMKDSTMLAAKHQALGNKCADCHSDTDNLVKLHTGVIGPPSTEQAKAMKKRSYTVATKDFCLKCHGSYADLAAKTAASTELKDSAGTVVNPHAVSQNASHQAKAGFDECYNCHSSHRASPSPTGFCYTCHHQQVLECGPCHAIPAGE